MKKIFRFFLTFVIGIFGIYKIVSKKNKELLQAEEAHEQIKSQFEVLYRWICNNQNHKQLLDYFNKYKIKRIAIYGNGKLGKLLLNEIKENTDVEVVVIIDKKATSDEINGISVIGLSDLENMGNVDAIIVTPIQFYDEIENDLLQHDVKVDIISLEDIIYVI